MRFFKIVASAVLLLFFSLSGSYFLYSLKATASASQSFSIIVEQGEGIKEVSSLLSQKGLIRSVAAFKLYALLSGSAHRLKPGLYQINSSFSIPEIIRILVAGPDREITVTISEGMTLKDIDFLLNKSGVIKRGALLSAAADKNLLKDYPFSSGKKSLEGLLFPDTYRFHAGSTGEVVLKKLLDNFQSKAWPSLEDNRDWYDILKIASLLEKEVPLFEDRQIVAGIIGKRIKESMAIQVDATIVYAKCDGNFLDCESRRLAKSDFNIDSPYNTYKYLGLPPTPIGNPGLAAIRAALTPQRSPYWFYLSDPKTDRTIFSKDFNEHNDKRAKYLGL